jgi:Ca2+-binding RTX toxin-like protein
VYTATDVSSLRVRGAGGNDILGASGVAKPLVAWGGGGNDALRGGSVNDTLIGGGGNDVYYFDADTQLGSDTLDESGGGIDTINLSDTSTQAVALNLALATAQVVNSNLTLTLGSDATFENAQGGALNDTLRGNGLVNTLIGGPAGADTLIGGANNDNLIGGSGNDVLEGQAGNDTLNGGADNDIYWFDTDSALGSDTLSETGGIDSLNFSATTTRVVSVNLSNAAAQVVNPNLTLTLDSAILFENALGGALGDTLIGNGLSNTLTGNGGSDILEGLGANDLLRGGAGDDLYRFDMDNTLGIDFLDESAAAGGAGVDTLDFSSTTTRNTAVNLGLASLQTISSGRLSINLQSATAFENAIGGSLVDWFTGNSVNNVFTGGPGNDVYWFDADTSQGSDTLVESPTGGIDTLNFSNTTTQSVLLRLAQATAQVINANLTLTLGSADGFENVTGGALGDILVGNGAANVLRGGGGRDLIIGREGADFLYGDAGEDILVAGTTSHDNDVAALAAIVAEWTSGSSYETRTTNLRNGSGVPRLAGTSAGAGQTAFNDSSVDNLIGGADQDWIFKGLDDIFANPEIGELIELL